MSESAETQVQDPFGRSHAFDEAALERLRQKWTPWPTGKQRPFDEDLGVKKAVKARHYQYDGSPSYYADMSVIQDGWQRTDGVLSRAETAFWFSLLISPDFLYDNYEAPEVDEDWVRARLGVVDEDTPWERYIELMEERNVLSDYYGNKQTLARLLREVAPYEEALRFLGENLDLGYAGGWIVNLGPPPEDKRDVALEVMHDLFDGLDYSTIWVNDQLAQMLSMIPYQEAIEGVLKRQLEYNNYWTSEMIRVAFKLDDTERAAELLNKVKRRSYYSPTNEEIQGFFATFGFDHLDILFKKLIYPFRKSGSFKNILAEALKIKAPEVVETIYSYLRTSSLKPLVEPYALTGEAYALEGLLRLTHSRSGKRDWALAMMRKIVDDEEAKKDELLALAEEHHPGRIVKLIKEEFFSDGVEEDAEPVEYMPEDEWPEWATALAEVEWPKGKNPDWLRVESMDPLYTPDDERPLPPKVSEGLFAAAYSVFQGRPKREDKARYSQLIDDVLEQARHASTEHLVLELIRYWDATREPDHGDWILNLAGLHGGVAVTAAIDHYIREQRDWRELNKHRDEAKLAIRVLANLDTPEARHDLLWQSQHLQDESLKLYAKKLLDTYMEENKLDREEFEDLAVPTFDLERGGTRVFDFGTRQLQLVVQGRHDIHFTDVDSKKTYRRWPPKRKTDDEDKYSAARDQYMHISEPLRIVFDEQNERAERSMMTGRHWKAERWREHIGDHPILGHLARRLLWKIIDKKGNTVEVVLPDAEGTFMNLDFDEITPDPKKHALALVHPVELDEEDRLEWIEQLADFEIIQPFDQLERPVYRIEDAEEALAGMLNEQMSHDVIAHALEMGWEKGDRTYRRLSSIKYTPTDAKSAIHITFSGYLEETSQGLRMNSWSMLSYTGLKIGNAVIHDIDHEAPKNLKKVSPIGFSEAVYWARLAIKRAASDK